MKNNLIIYKKKQKKEKPKKNKENLKQNQKKIKGNQKKNKKFYFFIFICRKIGFSLSVFVGD